MKTRSCAGITIRLSGGDHLECGWSSANQCLPNSKTRLIMICKHRTPRDKADEQFRCCSAIYRSPRRQSPQNSLQIAIKTHRGGMFAMVADKIHWTVSFYGPYRIFCCIDCTATCLIQFGDCFGLRNGLLTPLT